MVQTNESDQVAMKYRNPIPHVVDGIAFVVKYNISLAWVPPAKAADLARRRENCSGCGGGKYKYLFASEQEVHHWTHGHPTRKPCDNC